MSDKTQAFESLICTLLRGGIDTSKMNTKELRAFIYKAGVALHNIPHNLTNNKPLDLYQLICIDELDPSSKKNDWGNIVKNIAIQFGPIPIKERTSHVHEPKDLNIKVMLSPKDQEWRLSKKPQEMAIR